MTEQRFRLPVPSALRTVDSMLEKLPPEAKKWVESLPWSQRSYVLSLCHLMCASTPEMQAEFLDNYTADGLVSRTLEDRDTQQRVNQYLKQFQIKTELSESVFRTYIRQFYIHSSQDVRRQPDLYLESALRLVVSTEERNNVFNYILGFELIKMMFKMSWLQHEKLYQLQINQEDFYHKYIKPIQYAHKVNGIVTPKQKATFFDKRDYFVQEPEIKDKKLIELEIATFTTHTVMDLGFSVIRNINSLVFDYEYIFKSEQESVFSQ
ncbi:cobyrinic acid a,c-diamide synthase [Microcoleus sp. FACHB-831]|jgi:hypothetical protein|uniref:cobyrinic acid a,c-diamide synthase n=1 Tax=Microcoleus sp. FACHB-831 TaxID=2692827 RepID=UPI001681E89C|nr:cobyrinic acid a,c-diamide synthase [Microcoleus sp. FACHB-831]MBD1922833.1 cobyrinic acid a,c-diamide synthase [Microcoleus sp. FACHB-831]